MQSFALRSHFRFLVPSFPHFLQAVVRIVRRLGDALYVDLLIFFSERILSSCRLFIDSCVGALVRYVKMNVGEI